jgi:hypothetical protein
MGTYYKYVIPIVQNRWHQTTDYSGPVVKELNYNDFWYVFSG